MHFEILGILRENNGTRIKSGGGALNFVLGQGGTRNFIKKRKCFIKTQFFHFSVCVETIAINKVRTTSYTLTSCSFHDVMQ